MRSEDDIPEIPAVVVEEGLDRKHSHTSAVTWREVNVCPVSSLPAEDCDELLQAEPGLQVED